MATFFKAKMVRPLRGYLLNDYVIPSIISPLIMFLVLYIVKKPTNFINIQGLLATNDHFAIVKDKVWVVGIFLQKHTQRKQYKAS